ncbi:MAG: response regulator [Pseudomonadota bacterium]
MKSPLAWLRGLGLQTQLTIMAGTLILLTMSLGSYLTISGTIRDARDQALSSIAVFAEATSRGTDFGLKTQNPAELAKSVAFLNEVPIVAGVEIRNMNGTRIYREMFEELPREQLLSAKTDASQLRINPFGAPEIYRVTNKVYAPLAGDALRDSNGMGKQYIGSIDTIVNLSATQQRLRNSILITLVSSSGIAILGGVFSFFAAKSILKPVRDLLTGLKNVSEGNFSHKLPNANGKELKRLINGFNVMVDGLRHYRRETLRAREILEQRVEERTQQLFDEKERAEAASRTKSEFLARMSHEIRTPMNGVLGMTELLLMSELGDSERRYARTIRSSGAALLDIINDILDFSKIEAGKMTLETAPFSVQDLAEEAVAMLSGNARKKAVDLAVDVDPTLLGSVSGDSSRLRQVLVNLGGNAIKFTEKGQVWLEVLRADQQPKDESLVAIRFAVHDTGIGIHPDKQASIFESFIQEDGSTTRRFGGTGLGLAISRQIVELMGGQIQVESAPGEGSVFSFTLTLPYQEATPSVPEVDFSKLRVFTMSPFENVTRMLNRKLDYWSVERENFDALADVERALYESDKQPDLILFDHAAMNKGVIEAWGRYRERNAESDWPATVLITSDESIDAASLNEHGVSDVLRKPLMSDALAGLLRVIAGIDEAPTVTMKGQGLATDAAAAMGALRVLVVEDNKVNQRVTRAMLDKLGATHEIAENGLEALDITERKSFDVVLMDCQMPEMDGFTATQAIRDREQARGHARVPIIALTANALQGDDGKCFAAGMDDYMTKPFKLEALREKLEYWQRAPTQSHVA